MASNDPRRPTCPDEADLHGYQARELPADAATALGAHLSQCPTCAARHAAMLAEHDAWVARLRTAGAPPARGPQTPPDTHLERDEIPGYEILDELGRGGQGIVYRAVQKSTKREVALKVLREGPDASPATRRRFEREIELVAALNHPHIVTVFDSGETRDRRRYLIMDYVRGRRLDRYLAAEAPTRSARLALFSRMAHAVNYAQQRGVIHRDLKPSNVLISDDREPHILDFGMARRSTEADVTAVTMTGQVTGTLPYMSPEQTRGLPEAVDVRSDVYALGVILYELLAGGYPYPVTGNTLEVLRHIAVTPPARLTGRAAADPINGELETLVFKALAKEPERRYQTAGDLARDIDHYLAGEPIEAKRDSGLYVLRKTLRRYRLATGVVLAFVLLVTASAVALGVMYGRQSRLRAEAERQAALAQAAQIIAQRRFDQVRELARFCVIDLDPLIARLSGAAPARQALVEKGLTYLNALAQEAGDDHNLQLELAAAYTTIGDVQGDSNSANLGDLNGALASYHKAERILAAALTADPADAPTINAALLNGHKIGDALGTGGDLAGALARYQDVLTRGARWLTDHPHDENVRRHVGNAHQRIGNVLQARGDLDGALTHFQKSMEFAQANAAERPDDLWRLRGVGVGLTKIANIHYARRELPAALANHREFLALSEQLRGAYPEDLIARRDVGIAQQWIGIVLADQGERDAALESFAASNTTFDGLLADDPQDTQTATLLVTNWSKAGEIHLSAGRRDEATRSFERALALVESLAQRQPDRPEVLRLLGVSYYKLAELDRTQAQNDDLPPAERSARLTAARDWLAKCRDVFLDMRDRNLLPPTDANVPDELAAEIAACDDELRRPVERPDNEPPSSPR